MTSNDKTIRILHVLYAMNTGGIQAWLMRILRHIDRECFQIDFLVHRIYPCSYSDEITALGSRIIICPHPRQYLSKPWLYARTFKQILFEYGPYDIIHSHVAHFNGYILRLSQQVGIPVRIAHSHDNASFLENRANLFRRSYINLMKWLIPKHATIGLGCSRQAAAYQFGSTWKTDPRWRVLYCGVNLATFKGEPIDSKSVRAEFGIPSDALVIGHVGRFEEQKNHAFLVDIAAEVAKRKPKMRLLLVGDGTMSLEIKQKIARLGLTELVIFAGVRSDVARLMLSTMDVFVFPSFHEGLGMVLIEAQAAGLPCIFSDVIPEEADVVKTLVRRMSLSKSASVWAEVVIEAQNVAFSITQMNALALVEKSPFNIDINVKKLVEIYETSCQV